MVEGGPCRAYLKRLSPSPSSHWGRCTLIRCAVTQDQCMRRVARTKVIAILLLTYQHIFKYDCFHFVARRLAILFRVAVASTPSSLSTEVKKGEKCQRCWSQASRYILFFPVPPLGGTFQYASNICMVILLSGNINMNDYLCG